MPHEDNPESAVCVHIRGAEQGHTAAEGIWLQNQLHHLLKSSACTVSYCHQHRCQDLWVGPASPVRKNTPTNERKSKKWKNRDLNRQKYKNAVVGKAPHGISKDFSAQQQHKSKVFRAVSILTSAVYSAYHNRAPVSDWAFWNYHSIWCSVLRYIVYNSIAFSSLQSRQTRNKVRQSACAQPQSSAWWLRGKTRENIELGGTQTHKYERIQKELFFWPPKQLKGH